MWWLTGIGVKTQPTYLPKLDPAKGEASRPATGAFPGVNRLQGQLTEIPYAPLMAGPNSPLSRRYVHATIS